MFPSVEFALPDWVADFLKAQPATFATEIDRMKLAIELAKENVEKGTGGPFGAAIFDVGSNKLISVGLNLVESTNLSMTHAEIVAISLAQKITGSYDLSKASASGCELVSSCEPCAMCMGAIQWAGISVLLCGASDSDARDAGFDEGIKPQEWAREFEEHGIIVKQNIMREEAARVLNDYAAKGGKIYNAEVRE